MEKVTDNSHDLNMIINYHLLEISRSISATAPSQPECWAVYCAFSNPQKAKKPECSVDGSYQANLSQLTQT